MKTHLLRSSVPTGRNNHGFTLVEAMVSVGVTSLTLAALASFSYFMARSFISLDNYDQMNETSRHTLDTMGMDIRQASALSSFATNQLVFSTLTGSTFSYTYNNQAGTLTRTWTDGVQTILLTNCDYLAFNISQRSPSNNYTFYATGLTANAKLVEVTWECANQILGMKANTETVQTAQIVMRN